ncbi:helix-turn-helix domain-containing protein [Herbaspirillum rubrisubalbicans]|uniref:helix-turn-helix domain-containing protein n=1 Tax=Herbaspirillum rubrisubalbicans TaxID=80842 RepID=UPI0015C54757|nr:helix-turn-helix transcriptional regulator [Herbaspirillum rubrisubalbicans]
MTTLSERIEKILSEHPALGQSGLAEAAGASKSVVNQWMDGKIKSMRLDYALKIERRLGYDHVWLVLGEGFEIMTQRKSWPFSVSLEAVEALPEESKQAIGEFLEYQVSKWRNGPSLKSPKAG